MNIAIVGKSKVGNYLRDQLEAHGFTPLIFENIDTVKKLYGEFGDFCLRTSDNSAQVAAVIMAEGAAINTPLNETVYTASLIDDIDINKLKNTKGNVVLLLDYTCESPAFVTNLAIKTAIELSMKKKSVVYLSKFMRISGYEQDKLFNNARNLGVTFIKYNYIDITCDNENCIYNILLDDGYGKIEIDTNALITADPIKHVESNTDVGKALGFKKDVNGFANGEKNYLFPTFTNRRGIYSLNGSASDNVVEDLKKQVEFTIFDLRKELIMEGVTQTASTNVLETAIRVKKYAKIDEGKCAFCYTCYRACPHQAMAPDYDNSAMKNLNSSCYACGICVSVCPADAVSIVDESEQEQKFTSKSLKIFCCENSGQIALNKLADKLGNDNDNIEVIPMACGGSVSTEAVLSALKSGGNVIVAVCPDDACKHFEGNKRALRQFEKAGEMLRRSGIDAGRLELVKLSHAMPDVLYDYIKGELP